MKKLLVIYLFMLAINELPAQNFAVLRLGSTDASTLSVGDTVYVPVYVDEIVNSGFLGLEISMEFDYDVIDWLGEPGNPENGVTAFNPALPYDPAAWFFNENMGNLDATWIDPNFIGTSLNSGDLMFSYVFTYQGGNTGLTFDETNTYVGNPPFEMYLINGCICDTLTYPAIFHISSNWNPLEEVDIIIGSELKTSDQLGMVIFQLPSGTYSYIASKPGYETEAGEFAIDDNAEIINITLDVTVNTNDYSKPDMFSVFPNPSGGVFYIKSDMGNSLSGSYTVTGINGKEVTHGRLTFGIDTKVDLSDYGQGIYFITIISDAGVARSKIIVRE